MEFLKNNLDMLVITVLGVMSFLMLWVVVERFFYFKRVVLSQFSHPDELNIGLTRNLTLLYSVGANAPYIGLLGTVIGILITFYDLGQGGTVDVNTIMLGLALALKATAMGLFVAIPAITFYNGLLRKVDVLTAQWRKEYGCEKV
ncbi:MAG: TonB-system energizer ExbB [Sulfuriflexus sp.]|nr:TonB-system energizer ExbB [Sulfuriflexus sp.]